MAAAGIDAVLDGSDRPLGYSLDSSNTYFTLPSSATQELAQDDYSVVDF